MAITSKQTINVLGLNTQGFKSNSAYVPSLLKTNDVIFLSEHWLSNAEKYLISNVANPTHNVYFNAAEKQMMGRPYGGNCFMIHKDLTKNISVVHEDNNILAIKIVSDHQSLLILGIYLSCFHNKHSLEKYQDQLNIMTSILDMYIAENEIMIYWRFSDISRGTL